MLLALTKIMFMCGLFHALQKYGTSKHMCTAQAIQDALTLSRVRVCALFL